MNSKPSLALIFSLFLLATGCGPSSSSIQREAELAELKSSNSNLVAQLQQAKLQSDKDKSMQDSELTELKTEITDLNERLQQTEKQAEENKTKLEAEQQMAARQQEAQELANKKDAAAQKAFKELIKLKSIAGTGVTYDQYSERLLDTKTAVEIDLLEVDDSKYKSSVSDILATYLDARNYWALCNQYSFNPIITDSDLINSITNAYGKYKITNVSPATQYFTSKSIVLVPSFVSSIFDFASKQINDLVNTSPYLLK